MLKLLSFLLIFIFSIVNASEVKFFDDVKSDTTRYANVSIVKQVNNYSDKLYVNKKNINVNAEKDNFFIMQLFSRVNLPDGVVYIIWGGTGGSIDHDTNKQCKFLSIQSNSYKISELTYCNPFQQPTWVNVESNNIIKVRYNNIVPYAESQDIGVISYNYKTNNITNTVRLKSEQYYRNKFANLTPKEIYVEAQNNFGINNDTGLLDTSHVNSYGQRYCFKFNALKNPPHDRYYNLLKKSCLY